jgi:hypothetical protein
MPEYLMSITLGQDYEVYFEAADEDEADRLAGDIADELNGELTFPTRIADRVAHVLDVSYDGPNESTVNHGPDEVDE